MDLENGSGGQRVVEVHVDVSTLRGELRGADTMVYVVNLKGTLADRWAESYRVAAEELGMSRRFELDPVRGAVRFACRTADGNALVFEMLERLEELVGRVNQIAGMWRSQAPRPHFSPEPLRAR